MRCREDFLFGAVGEDPALSQKHHTFDFRNNLRNVVSDEQNAKTATGGSFHSNGQVLVLKLGESPNKH